MIEHDQYNDAYELKRENHNLRMMVDTLKKNVNDLREDNRLLKTKNEDIVRKYNNLEADQGREPD